MSYRTSRIGNLSFSYALGSPPPMLPHL